MDSNYFTLIPWEIIIEILSYIPIKCVCSFSQTCSFLYNVCNDSMLWRDLFKRDFYHFNGAIGLDLLKSQENSLTLSQSKSHPSFWAEAPWKHYYIDAYKSSNITSLSWITKYDSNIKERQDHAATRCGDYLLVYAGFTNDKSLYVLDTCAQISKIKNLINNEEKCDLQSVKTNWYKCDILGDGPQINQMLYGHTLTNIDKSTLILYGGMKQSGYCYESSEVWLLHLKELDIINDNSNNTVQDKSPFQWMWKKPPINDIIPPPRGYHSATLCNGKLWIFGGTLNGRTLNDFWYLDLTTWKWYEVEDLEGNRPIPRMGHSCIAYNSDLLFFGGSSIPYCQSPGDDFSDAYIFNTISCSWRKLSNCPGRYIGRRHASVLVGSRIIFIAGSCPHTNNIAWFDLIYENWHVPNVIGNKPSPRVSLSAHFCNGLIFVFGGCTNYGLSNELFLLDISDSTNAIKNNKIDIQDTNQDDRNYDNLYTNRFYAGNNFLTLLTELVNNGGIIFDDYDNSSDENDDMEY